MFASLFQTRKRNVRKAPRSTSQRSMQLQIESLEARTVPSTVAPLVRSAAQSDWPPPPAAQIREMFVGVSPLGGIKVDSGGANGNHVASASLTRGTVDEIPQISRLGGVKVDSGGANGNHVISPLGGIKVDSGGV